MPTPSELEGHPALLSSLFALHFVFFFFLSSLTHKSRRRVLCGRGLFLCFVVGCGFGCELPFETAGTRAKAAPGDEDSFGKTVWGGRGWGVASKTSKQKGRSQKAPF